MLQVRERCNNCHNVIKLHIYLPVEHMQYKVEKNSDQLQCTEAHALESD